MRARDLGIVIGDLPPGPRNAITDVPGVRVGHTTLISGEGPLEVGRGPVRTGVTVIVPHDGPSGEAAYAGSHILNGNGEVTGLAWIAESGLLTTPIGLTNTNSVGVVRDALIAAHVEAHPDEPLYWSLPVVGETWDGYLNDVRGQHVQPEHVRAALENAGAEVAEGNVGGGTGMKAFGFKAGIGTASRVALDRAAELARRLDAELTLLHVVVPLPALSDAVVLVSPQELNAVQAREDEKELARWAAEAERAAGRPVRARARAGDAAAEILRHAREEGCDLLVIGTHGRTGIPRLVLGSVAERVARQAPCPVLVVHDHAAADARAEREELSQYT